MAKIVYALVYLVSLLPLRVLYLLADVLAGLMHTVIRYRRRVTRDNLTHCFPELPVKEIRRTERRFYRFLADYFVETLKLASMSEKEMRRRMRFEGLDEVNADLRRGRCVSLFLGHYGNWEWVSSMPLHLWEGAHPCQIYHHLHNRTAAYIFEKLRTRFGATNIPMEDTLTVIGHDWRDGVPNICGYIADQSPKYASLHHFVQFFGRQTAVLTGTERISRLVHAPVYYCEMTRPRRGRYVCRFIRMTDDASALPKFTLTDDYWRRLEAQIRREPYLWLWSHRRWKHTAARFRELYPDDWSRRLSRL